jgi:hypothetical protein
MKTQVKALKVKVKSLAAEAGIIRLEERRAIGGKRRDDVLYASLRQHRVWDVRKEQRSSLLAYAFLRGRAYSACERPADDNKPDIDRVQSLVKKFGPVGVVWTKGTLERMVAEWVAGTIKDNPFAKPEKQAA